MNDAVVTRPLVGNFDPDYLRLEYEKTILPKAIHYSEIVGFNVAEARTRVNMAYTAAARQLDWIPSQWADIEKGTHELSLLEFRQVCRVLGMHPMGLLGQIEDGEESARMQGVTVYLRHLAKYDTPATRQSLAYIMRGPGSKYVITGKGIHRPTGR